MRSTMVVLALSSASFAYAAPIQYSSQSAFDAAATTTTYTIPATPQVLSNPFTFGPVTFSDNTATFEFYNDGQYGPGQTYLGDVGGIADNLAFAPTTAIGFLISSTGNFETLTFTLGGNSYIRMTSTSPIFVGFTSSSAFSNITITDTGQETDILKFQVASANGTPAVTPEPSGIVLLGTGVAGVAGMLRRKRWLKR